jgi:hypothetical protein
MIETITVEHPDTPGALMIINKTDFNPEIHKIYEPTAPEGVGEDASAPKEEGASKPKGRPKKNPED